MERLARGGIEVNLAACPLMPVRDPQAFARRAKESGASGAWVGSLRLLKDDAFHELLARNGWLFILDADYRDRVAAVLQGSFPQARRRREPKAALPAPVQRPPFTTQRSLFEGM
jgi:hypothetical protein